MVIGAPIDLLGFSAVVEFWVFNSALYRRPKSWCGFGAYPAWLRAVKGAFPTIGKRASV
jgi:hypothetical protein